MSDRPGVSASPNKKGKGKATDTNRKSGPNSERSQQPQKRKRVASQISSIDHGTHIGVRRSPRKRYEPLEWWRLEKAVYSLRAMGDANVPHIKEIIRLPKEPPQLLGAAGRRYRKRKPQLSASQVSDTEKATKSNLEEGWDDDTKSHGVVVDYITNEEVERHVISTFGMLDPKPAANEDFFFERVFADGGFMAAGYITIPPGRAKPNKNTKHNTYVFYVIEGAVNFVINQESFIIATGGEFLAPRGNTYYIQNISDRQAKLFFAQARKAPMGEDDEASRYAYNHRF
ncbi:hypothetical protein OE88DRAFT_679448 [Heliocybe sulcata]|uniref:CENP-C homolog n=1 Tax=Heliocybe sulcata TaxID=5364 RepID=A0A5C3NEZ2_9AGAM|nr:hypothetical protein OE88DRAFT_679448 [Heliocybe sulcata]